MKTALIISGQPRSVRETFDYIRLNVLEPNTPDVFVHMWDDPNLYGKRPVSAGGVIASNPIQDDIIEVVQQLYMPVAHIVERPITFDERNYNENKFPQIKPQNSLSQRYSILRAFQLLDARVQATGVEYDAVIRMRFDWALKEPVIVEQLPLDCVTVPNDCPHHGGVNDQFAVTNMNYMRKYANLFNEIPALYDSGVPFCDEILLGQSLARARIPVNMIHIPYHLQRADGAEHLRVVEDVVE